MSSPHNGTVSLADGQVSFTPTTNFTGNGDYTYTVTDGLGMTATAVVTVKVVNSTTSQYTSGTSGNDLLDFTGRAVAQQGAGQAGNDTLIGGLGNDTLNGGAGDDVLIAGPGIDLLIGSTGSDTFILSKTALAGTQGKTAGITLVSDFEGAGNGGSLAGQDHIRLTGFSGAANLSYVGLSPGTTNKLVYEVTDGSFTGRFLLQNNGQAASVHLTAGDWINDVPPTPPVAATETYQATEEQALTVNAAAGVLANDSDMMGLTLTARLVSGPAHGSLTLNADGSFSYTPVALFHGTDSFTYQAVDRSSSSAATTVTLSVAYIDHPPIGLADGYTIEAGKVLVASAATGVLANDTDADGDPLMAQLVNGPAHGSLTLNANGSFSYTPVALFHGTDSFTYMAADPLTISAATTVTLNVTVVDHAPAALADGYAATEEQVLTVSAAAGVLANDTDAESDALVAQLVSGPAHGSLTLNADGSFSYTPVALFHGTDSFAYRAFDGTLASATATVTLGVAFVDHAPTALADGYAAMAGQAFSVAAKTGLLANDADMDGDALTALLVTGPKLGSLALGADGGFTYVPNVGASGTDSFTYKAYDGILTSDPTAASIVIAPKSPIAGADSFTTTTGLALKISVAALLGNDTDPQGQTLSVTAITAGHNGGVAFDKGLVTVTPTTGFTGDADFTYTTTNTQGLSAPGNVTVHVVATGASQYSPGSAGNDLYDFSGRNLAQQINSQAGNDTIIGGFGNDTLAGGTGDDVLTAGYGIDYLIGGAGSDSFVLSKAGLAGSGARSTGLTLISDFEGAGGGGSLTGQDHVKLTGFSAAASVKFVGLVGTSTQQIYEVDDGGFAGRFTLQPVGVAALPGGNLAMGDWLFG